MVVTIYIIAQIILIIGVLFLLKNVLHHELVKAALESLQIYSTYDLEKIETIVVVSYKSLSKKQEAVLQQILKSQFENIPFECRINKNLGGGMVISIADHTIDHTVLTMVEGVPFLNKIYG